jgi:hypothetical protein
MIRYLGILLFSLYLAIGSVNAHALQPGYLELRALGNDTWSVFWRKPDVKGKPIDIDAILSGDCQPESGPNPKFDGQGWSARWVTTCSNGLSGTTITIKGLERTRTDVLMRYELSPGDGKAWRFLPDAPSVVVPENPTWVDTLATYTGLGISHILGGFDHLLFVLALLLLIGNLKSLVGAVTAFTLAHSMTLGAAALDLVVIPGPPVEAVIALSIVFVAVEALKKSDVSGSLTARSPWLVSFGFGLIHGLGFGSALSEIGLPKNEIVMALLGFNVGVEIGQLMFISAVLILYFVAMKLPVRVWMPRIQIATVYGIGSMAAFWFFERFMVIF